MKKLFTLAGALLLFQFASAFNGDHEHAHNNGHTHHAYDAKLARTWRFEDKSVAALGTFLMTKEGKVYIEKEKELVSFTITELSWIDQKYIKRKIQEISKINAPLKISIPLSTKKSQSINPMNIAIAAVLLLAVLALIYDLKKRRLRRTMKVLVASTGAMSFFLLVMVSCGGSDDTPYGTNIGTSFTSNPATMDLAFAPYKPNVTTSWDNDYFYVGSNGMATHQMMVGITAWIAQVPIPQEYFDDNAWSIPLNTSYADNPVSIQDNLRRGAIGIAANGIPIFNPINASGLISKEIGELDEFGGHSGRGDDYHYHTAPLHLESTSVLQPIAYALDGFAVYGSKEPDGNMMEALDEYHGHEWETEYHYHGTETYPYMLSALRGEVTLGGSAPETQVEPQPQASALRGDPHPINSDNLIITALEENGSGNGYILTYTIGGVEGSVDYSWDANDLFTFIFNDVDGTRTVEQFQR